jgi:hypothetical protein
MGGFQPLNTNNSDATNYNQVNNALRQLDKEQVTKTFKQPGGNAVINGRLPYSGGYGSLYYDSTNVPRIIVGIAPDGDIDIGVSKATFDITQQYT